MKRKAIILVAGMGTRLKPRTDNTHKCLTEVNGCKILVNALTQLKNNSVDETILVVGYLSKQIIDVIGDSFNGMKISYTTNDLYSVTNTSYSILLGLREVKEYEELYVLEGDVFFEKTLLSRLVNSEYKNATVIEKYNPTLDGSMVEIGSDGFVKDWVHKKERYEGFTVEDKYKTVNIHKYSYEFVNKILLPQTEKSVIDFAGKEPLENIMMRIVRSDGKQIYGFNTEDDKWFEIDDENDLRIAESIFKDNKCISSKVNLKEMKTVYLAFGTDVIHEGHLNIVKEASKYGRVIAGVLSDAALFRYSRFPTVDFETRVRMVKEIPGISDVIIQNDFMYSDVLKEIRPDYVIHGDDWKDGPLSVVRKAVIDGLSMYGGKLVEIAYTRNETVKRIDDRMKIKLMLPEFRRKRLRQIIKVYPLVRVIEAHNGLTGLIAEKTVVDTVSGLAQFDAMWSSSLCDSTSRGKPDIELVDVSSRLQTLDEIMDVTTKPIIYDGDTGGLTEHFVYLVRTLERMGVSAIIIEDKTGLKKNSLFGNEVEQTQDTIENFCSKISAGKKVKLTDDFMIIARIESLILERGMEDALKRAKAYVEAGADGIMIHSRKKDPDEILEFSDLFRKDYPDIPLVVVPTSFNTVTEKELSDHRINIAIYANQLTRSSYPAMIDTAETILKHGRAYEADNNLIPFKQIIRIIPDEL